VELHNTDGSLQYSVFRCKHGNRWFSYGINSFNVQWQLLYCRKTPKQYPGLQQIDSFIYRKHHNYNFDDTAKAYGDNLVNLGGGFYGIFSGDVNQDGIIDAGDMAPVDNLAAVAASGLPDRGCQW